MIHDITVQVNDNGTLVVDSRLISVRLGVQHETLMRTIKKYEPELTEAFGHLRFEDEFTKNSTGATNRSIYVSLTEGQTAFLLSCSRNSPQVIEAKIFIAKEFDKARKLHQSSETFKDFLNELNESTLESSGGFVYLIKAKTTNYCKIGVSNKPLKRLTTLQIGSPLELVILDRMFSTEPFKLEAALHEYYAKYWVRGEWFDLTDEQVKQFIEIANRVDFDIEQKLLIH